ncbi:M64 family metallopeptidase [Actinomadura sp. HBU206391]|uniref:M64 family metallopeptidase n=1 Tax=Actinomadura sp. HBU206391 TaxID=2731692 RepID=UPI00165008F7|nr:M64 family metallopeptidase [Actinomadura sp. HBU206391]MBC6463176.1 peptidase [Actinomadura sp. HBU206391]
MWRGKAAKAAPALALAATVQLALLSGQVLSAEAANADEVGDATVVPIQVTGDPAKRFNFVILGDGYTEADMPKFRADVDKHLSTLWAFEPWKTYRSYVNVYAVEIVSGESGVSCDPDLTSARRTTPLKMGFWGGCNPSSVQRLLTGNNAAFDTYANLVTGTTNANRQVLALANSTTYGGAGGSKATASGGNALSSLIMPHEIGHSLGRLDDEYTYYARGVPGGAYTGGEPDSIHHTLLTERQMREQRVKWWRWLGEKSTSGGVIGRYEGGLYTTSQVWRPSEHSMMKVLGYEHDQVQREAMTQAIAAKVDLIQDHTPTTAAIGSDRVVWVETLHPADHTLRVTWTLDGRQVPGSRDEHNLDLRRLRLKPGTHTLTVTVLDPTSFVRDPAIRSSAALTRTRTWTIDTRIETAPDAVAPGFTGTTPQDWNLAAHNVVHAETTHPARSVPVVRWTVDGRRVRTTGNDRDLDLKRFRLRSGTHRITATVTDPAAPRGGAQTLAWTVDAQRPTVASTLSQPARTTGPAGDRGYVFDERFTMRLTPSDTGSGTPLAEFQVDGDGWYRYFGWPTDSNAPFLFTPLGTNIDDLVYGKLGKPVRTVEWDAVAPGYGRHTIEYRGIDAAGNVGPTQKFTVTLRKSG